MLATLGATPLLLDIFDPDPAVELLGKIAGAQRIEAELQAARTVARLCGGLPLALRIAGARLAARPDWPVAKLAQRLEDARERLAELGIGDLDVRASFQLSYQELPDEQAQAFRLLALWPGVDLHPWLLRPMLQVGEAIAEGLVDGLVTAQLVEPATARGRYRLHDLLRLFATEHLDQHQTEPDRAVAWARLAEGAAGLTHVLVAAVEPPGLHPELAGRARIKPAVALRWLEAERAGLVAVVREAAEHGPWAAAWQLAERLDVFLALRGYWADGERVARWAAEAAHQAGERGPEGRAFGNLGTSLFRQGRWDEAIEYCQKDLAICRELDDREGEGQALNNLANVFLIQGRLDEAADHVHEDLRICRELGDSRGEAQTLINLGNVSARQGLWDEAGEHYEQARKIFTEVGDRRGQAQALFSLGTIISGPGLWDQAREHYEQARKIFTEVGDRHGETQVIANLGFDLAEQGYLEEAKEHYELAHKVFHELGDRHNEAKTLRNLGAALARQGHSDQARGHWQEALTIFQELQPSEAARTSKLLAQIDRSSQPSSTAGASVLDTAEP